jgi:hypothetical protein
MLHRLRAGDKIIGHLQQVPVIGIEQIVIIDSEALLGEQEREHWHRTTADVKTVCAGREPRNHRINQPPQESTIPCVVGVVLVEVIALLGRFCRHMPSDRDKDKRALRTMKIRARRIRVERIRAFPRAKRADSIANDDSNGSHTFTPGSKTSFSHDDDSVVFWRVGNERPGSV